LQQLRELAGTDRRGTNLLGLVEAATALGFTARGVKGTYEVLPQAPLPAIVHVKTQENLGHFVVLYRVTPKKVIVADPAGGLKTLSRQEFCQSWTGYFLLLVPELAVSSTLASNVPVPPRRRFLGLLKAHTAVLTEAFVCTLLMTLLGVTTSYFIQHLVDSVLVRHEERLLNALGIGMVLVLLFRTLLGLLRQYLTAYVSRKVDLTLMAGYARHLLELPYSFLKCARWEKFCRASTMRPRSARL
jgi:ATP-binding cassette subfamily B protein